MIDIAHTIMINTTQGITSSLTRDQLARQLTISSVPKVSKEALRGRYENHPDTGYQFVHQSF